MPNFAHRVYEMAATADIISNVFKGMTSQDIISFGGGTPANEVLPVDIVRNIVNEVLTYDRRGVEALQYGKPQGIADLREAVANKLLAPKGLLVDPDQIMIISGGLESIYLTCQLYIEPGDVILVEAPTFVHAVECFDMFQAKCVAVDMDEEGLIIADLERKIQTHHPKMIYTIPTFQNPSGRTLSLERRRRLAELGSGYDVVILEDDPYRDLRYSGTSLPPIKVFDRTGHVVLANSFSKIFSPGARLGYICASPEAISALVNIKTATNSFTSTLSQVVCAEYFNRGYYDEHLPVIIETYKGRRDTMLECIDQYFPQGTKHTYPEGGLYIWVELPNGINTTRLLPAAFEQKLAYVAGEGFFTEKNGKGSNCMRLCFSNVSPENINLGIQRLGELIKNFE